MSTSSIPMYEQIQNELMEQIQSGFFQPGDRIPSEKELAERYHVSRITAVKALTELALNGYIYRVQGRGSFANPLDKHLKPSALKLGGVPKNDGEPCPVSVLIPEHADYHSGSIIQGITQTLQGLGLSILLSGVRCCYTLASDRPFCDGMVYTLRNTMTIVDDFSQIDDDFIKLAAYHPGTIDPFMDKLQSKWGSAVNVARSGEEWCDFNLSNKGMGLKDLMRTLNISPAEAAAFGDNYNDESMLAEVGHPFLMVKADAGLWKPGIRKCDHVLDVWRAIIRHGGELPDVIE